MAEDAYSGYARGWFVIATADELPPGAVKALKYFGEELVIWRTGEGQLHVLDAFCPHLGAHLGVGGTVRDGNIRCPFHAWEFDGQGRCAHIPYSEKIPKAKLRPWTVLERNGLVFLWHGRGDAAPDWEPPALAEYGDPAWTTWDSDRLTVYTHPKEVVDNIADKAHFPVVHGTHLERFDNEFTDHMAVQRTAGVAYPRGGGQDRFQLVATYYGPAYQVSVMQGYLESRLFLAHTPIDEGSLDLRFGVSLKIVGDAERTSAFAGKYIENLRTGFYEDIRLWENKRYRDRPVICAGDGPLGRMRLWYRQFYE